MRARIKRLLDRILGKRRLGRRPGLASVPAGRMFVPSEG
jgi:hypothetical protein